MSYTHPAYQSAKRVWIEHIANHPVRLALVQPTLVAASDDPACILATVLQQGQAFADFRSDVDVRVMKQ